LAIEKLKSYKSPGIDQILSDFFKAGSRTIYCEIHKLITSVRNKEELPEERKASIVVPMYKKGDKRECYLKRYITFANYVQNFIQNPAVKVNSICRGNYWGSPMWISTQQVIYL